MGFVGVGNQIVTRLVECLSIYGHALDQIEPTYAFLSFWQILEIIALKDSKNLKFDKIKSRIAIIFENNPLISDVLDVVVGKRNDFVHKGRMIFSLDDVNQIKVLSDSCIWFLWNHVNRLENVEGLNYFFENAPLTQKQLTKKSGVIEYLKKS